MTIAELEQIERDTRIAILNTQAYMALADRLRVECRELQAKLGAALARLEAKPAEHSEEPSHVS